MLEIEVEALFQSFADDIYHFLYNLTKSQSVAEDLLQETFIAALQFDGEVRNARGWLFTVAYHLFTKFHKKQKKNDAVELTDINEPVPSGFETGSDVALMRQELLARLRQVDHRLAEVFVLMIDLNMSQNEIATTLGVSLRSVSRLVGQLKQVARANYKVSDFY